MDNQLYLIRTSLTHTVTSSGAWRNWLSGCSSDYDYELRQYNRGSQKLVQVNVFTEATVLETTEAAASVASDVATALWMTELRVGRQSHVYGLLCTEPKGNCIPNIRN